MTHADALIIIEWIEYQQPKLNAWERDFLRSMKKSRFPTLTPAQAGKLKQLYGKFTGGGVYQRKQYIK